MSKQTMGHAISLPSIHANRLIVATNRGPIEYFLGPENTLQYQHHADGIGTVLLEVGKRIDLTWIAVAMTEGDRIALRSAQQNGKLLPSPLYSQNMQLRYVAIPETVYQKHYEKISNQVFWFLQHYLHNPAENIIDGDQIQDAWTNGYCVTNQAIADAVSAEIDLESIPAVVMLHDYHLYLASSMIRKEHSSVVMQQFIHIPWPDIRYWYFLPSNITQAIYLGLIGNDIIGFQTELDRRNFLEGACRVLEDAIVDFDEGTIWWQGRRTWVRAYPISISVTGERQIIECPAGRQSAEKIRSLLGEQTIMRVDRIEPTKNIVLGFQAYAQLLDEHHDLLGKVTFLAFLVPSRQALPEYQQYNADVLEIIEAINQKYSTDSWTPIHAFIGDDRTRALVAMQFYDVLLVNSIIDGMNLVAKEGPIINQRNGILVLSRTVGAFQQLSKASIPISPRDIAETAQALYKALTLSPEERLIKATLARQLVERDDLNVWLAQQIQDINELLTVFP